MNPAALPARLVLAHSLSRSLAHSLTAHSLSRSLAHSLSLSPPTHTHEKAEKVEKADKHGMALRHRCVRVCVRLRSCARTQHTHTHAQPREPGLGRAQVIEWVGLFRVGSEWVQNGSRSGSRVGFRVGPEWGPEWVQNGSRLGPDWVQTTGSGSRVGPDWVQSVTSVGLDSGERSRRGSKRVIEGQRGS